MQLQDWFEKQYLRWQLKRGRATIEEFAEFLGISRSYLSLLLNGERTNLSKEKALDMAEKTDDSEILSILGYAVPGTSEPALPPSLRVSFDAAVDMIERVYKARGITDLSSPEALEIAKTILEDHGWTVTT
jgi:transcriptional regulator with XRE-family HTH domain